MSYLIIEGGGRRKCILLFFLSFKKPLSGQVRIGINSKILNYHSEMELLKFLLHIVRSFGLLGHEGGGLNQEILDTGGLLPVLPNIGEATGLIPSTDFKCPNYSPKGIKEDLVFCNTPNNRSCWFKPNKLWAPKGYDINTDYESSWPDGTHREVFAASTFFFFRRVDNVG